MILGTSRSVRVFAYPEPVDLRKGYDGLFGLVKTGLGRDPLSGDLFLFASKRRNSCKVLIWDGTGLCIFMRWRPNRRMTCKSWWMRQPTCAPF
jgi:transposase